jgi:hypothetical protein
LVVSLAGQHYTTTPTFPVARFGAGGEDQRLKHCIDPAMEVFRGRIVGQDQIYVVCAIEPIFDLPKGFLVRATLAKRKPRNYALRSCLNGAGNAQGRHARAGAFRDRAKARALFFRSERAHGNNELVRPKGIRHGGPHGGVRMCDGFFGQIAGGSSCSSA